MTVNERLVAAGLMEAYEGATASGDPKLMNQVLAQVGLWRDSDGMHWTLTNDA